MIWKTRRKSFDFSEKADSRGLVMGILNTTPDSFSDGGLHQNKSAAVAAALQMVADGAKIIDIGGESTRPGAPSVPAEQEIERTVPLIRALRERSDVLISIDTSKSSVASAALAAGADIVNDVTGLTGDPEMVAICADSSCGVVVMHMQGTPRTMQKNPTYENGVVQELEEFFAERLSFLTKAGIERESICLDPGIGFGKTVPQNLALIQQLGGLQSITQRPFLLGVSRKSFIGKLTGIEWPPDRDAATAAISALTYQQGIYLHRVHNVPMNVKALNLAEGDQANEKLPYA